MVYVILRDCVKIFVLEELEVKRTIKFDPIDIENIRYPTPMDMYKMEEIVFGN